MATSSIPIENNAATGTDYRPYLVLFLAAAMVRLFMLSSVDEPHYFRKYLYFANKLVAGEDLGNRLVDLSPAYLYLVTAYIKIFGENWQLLKYVHGIAGSLVCILIYTVGRRVFDNRIGFVAALLYAFYGNVVILESTLEPVAFVLLFNILAIYFLLKAEDTPPESRQRLLTILTAGLFTGVSIITKASFLFFLPLATLWILFGSNHLAPIKRRLVLVLAFNIVAVLAVFPITVRNYLKLNDLILVTADAGKVFFHGNATGATALQWTSIVDAGFIAETTDDPDNTHELFRDTASRLAGRQLKPSEASAYWTRRTLADILKNPANYLKLEINKALFFFHNYEMHFISSAHTEYKHSLQYPLVRFGLISALAIVGMALAFGRARSLMLIYGVIFLYLLSGLVFIVQSRYRTPAVPYLCLFAANGAWMIITMIRSRRFKTALASVAAGIALLALFHLSFKSELELLDRWQTATKTHYARRAWPLFNEGKLREAIAELDAVVEDYPDFSPAYNLRGRSYAILKEYARASEDFEKVIAFSPTVSEGYKNMGIVSYLEGNYEDARNYLLRARTLNPRDTHIETLLDKDELKAVQ
jgi:4-amino-4-deoxy-L-arabinose transferase-like glycosyltransferase